MKLQKIHWNLLDISVHLILAFSIAWLVYGESGKISHALIFLGAGVLIDLDHFLDYFRLVKGRFSLRCFMDSSYAKSGKVYLLLHSWELVCLLFFLSLASGSAGLFIFSLGLYVHLAVDNLQRRNPLSYFFTYRRAKKFDVNIIFPDFS